MNGRMARRRWLPVLIAAAIAVNSPAIVRADWLQDKFGRWYMEEDGSYPVSEWKEMCGEWYYFKDTGYAATGPLIIDDVQYYFHSSGVMASEEWIEYRDNRYYFNKDGSLARNCWIEELYYVDKQGAMVKNKRVDGIYINEDGIAEQPGDDFFY